VVDAILEEELFAKEVTDRAVKGADVASAAIVAGIKKAIAAVKAKKMTPQAAKNAVLMLFVGNALIDYTMRVHEIMEGLPKIIQDQIKAVKEFGQPLKQIAMISNIDIAAREAEKAGLAPTTGENT
jgi:hypothetical protein